MDILVLNGPNINMLGKREPNHYGHKTLTDIISELEQLADTYEVRLHNFQSNAEHEIIERIHKALSDEIEFIIINPAAFTHTSIAIRDALTAVDIPFIEVHLSNIYQREPFRANSYFSDISSGVISGLGSIGYQFALTAAVEQINQNNQS